MCHRGSSGRSLHQHCWVKKVNCSLFNTSLTIYHSKDDFAILKFLTTNKNPHKAILCTFRKTCHSTLYDVPESEGNCCCKHNLAACIFLVTSSSASFFDLIENLGRPGGGSNPGSSVYETDALPLGHRANIDGLNSGMSCELIQLLPDSILYVASVIRIDVVTCLAPMS